MRVAKGKRVESRMLLARKKAAQGVLEVAQLVVVAAAAAAAAAAQASTSVEQVEQEVNAAALGVAAAFVSLKAVAEA